MKEALEAFDKVRAAGGTNALALLAASEVLNLPVVETLNTLVADGSLQWVFVRNESWKNKEALVLQRVDNT